LSHSLFFFLPATPTPGLYPLSLHDALPISAIFSMADGVVVDVSGGGSSWGTYVVIEHQIDGQTVYSGYAHMVSGSSPLAVGEERSEEHTSELQSRENLVCRLLLEKKKKQAR